MNWNPFRELKRVRITGVDILLLLFWIQGPNTISHLVSFMYFVNHISSGLCVIVTDVHNHSSIRVQSHESYPSRTVLKHLKSQ